MNSEKHLAFVITQSIEDEDRPSTHITVVEPTVLVANYSDGITVEVTIPNPELGHRASEEVFESNGPLTGHDLYNLLCKLGFNNAEYVGSRTE